MFTLEKTLFNRSINVNLDFFVNINQNIANCMLIGLFVLVVKFIAKNIVHFGLKFGLAFSYLQEQYVFIHDVLLEWVKAGDTRIKAADLKDYSGKMDLPDENGIIQLDVQHKVMSNLLHGGVVTKSFVYPMKGNHRVITITFQDNEWEILSTTFFIVTR